MILHKFEAVEFANEVLVSRTPSLDHPEFRFTFSNHLLAGRFKYVS